MDDPLEPDYDLIQARRPGGLITRPAWESDRARFELPLWFDAPPLTVADVIERWNTTDWTYTLALAHPADELSSARAFDALRGERPDIILTPPADVHPDLLLNALHDFLLWLLEAQPADITQFVEADGTPAFVVRGRPA